MLSDVTITSTIYSSKFLIHVMNKCKSAGAVSEDCPAIKIEVDKNIVSIHVSLLLQAEYDNRCFLSQTSAADIS